MTQPTTKQRHNQHLSFCGRTMIFAFMFFSIPLPPPLMYPVFFPSRSRPQINSIEICSEDSFSCLPCDWSGLAACHYSHPTLGQLTSIKKGSQQLSTYNKIDRDLRVVHQIWYGSPLRLIGKFNPHSQCDILYYYYPCAGITACIAFGNPREEGGKFTHALYMMPVNHAYQRPPLRLEKGRRRVYTIDKNRVPAAGLLLG